MADRERAPMYVIGETTGDHRFVFEDARTGEKPIDLEMTDMFGNPPKTVMEVKPKENISPMLNIVKIKLKNISSKFCSLRLLLVRIG